MVHRLGERKLEVIDEEQPAFMEMMNLLFYKSGDSGGLINQDQKMDFGRLVEEVYFPQSGKIQEEMEASIAWGMEVDEAARICSEAMKGIDKEAMRRLQEEVLLPAQYEWLVQALREKKRKSFGVP